MLSDFLEILNPLHLYRSDILTDRFFPIHTDLCEHKGVELH